MAIVYCPSKGNCLTRCLASIESQCSVSINRVTWSSYPFPKIASKRTPSATIIPGIVKIMSVSFIGELNQIVIFRSATAHPRTHNNHKRHKSQLLLAWTLYEASRTGISDHHIRLTREHQQWQRSSTQKALRFAGSARLLFVHRAPALPMAVVA